MAKKVKDPGFGYQSLKNAKRLINDDGTSNVIHVNSTKNWSDLYSHLIEISWRRFFFFVILVYTIINILFAVIYNIIGIEQITPSTGNVFRDFKEHRAIMFRLMNSRKNMMIEPHITVTLSVSEIDEKTKDYKRNFYQLSLERDKIMYLPTMWTVVHELNEKSPLAKYSNKELQKLDAEMYILLEYHDQAFSQKLFKIYSYKFDQLKVDMKFDSSFSFNEEGFTILDHHKLNELTVMN